MATLIPESPSLHSGYTSPDVHRPETSCSRRSNSPRFLTDPSPSTILPLLEEASGRYGKGKGNDLRIRLILRHAMKWGIERGDVDLVGWLIDLQGEWATLLDEEVQGMEDDDGWGIVGMSIQSSCGRQEIEEIVRSVVSRWGISVGPREGTDKNGWTPLHLATLISTPPLISFLLNRGASPHALTNRGLTPLDLVSGVSERADIAVFLEHSSASSSVDPVRKDSTSLSARRQEMLSKRRQKAAEILRLSDEAEKNRAMECEKEKWVRELAAVVEVSPELLLPHTESKNREEGDDMDWQEMSDDDEEEDQVENELVMGPSKPDSDYSMLVFSISNLPAIFDIFITNYRPVVAPLEERTLPANALYLYARFAYYRCDDSWLEELLDGAVERIEQGVYSNSEDLAYLAFWAYNSTVLLHLLRSDKDLSMACENEEVNLLCMMEELINAIQVFIIRVAERRIDAVLDGALLDHETLEDFNDVRFEGEWTLFRSFGAKKPRGLLPKASQIFSNTSTSNGTDPTSSPSIFGTLRDNVAAASPLRTLANRASSADLRGNASKSGSTDSIPIPTSSDATTPRQITDILSAVLMVLHLYEVNPAMTIQAFSQIFFWIACELFNRILTRKKYLCRSKAVQIRMNLTVLEDWIRANGLPVQTATKYFEPVNQLLTWLQCLSQVREFDTLIGTMQNLKSINPLQMRRAVRDYRYEVNEGRMTDECGQYLAQLQKDWEKRRIQLSVQAVHKARQAETSSLDSTHSTSIDDLFDGNTSLTDLIPQSAPECFGELLDSRYMLPFVLPGQTEYLVATPPTGAAFSNASLSIPTDGSKLSRPSSRSSFALSRPMGWALPRPHKLRRLPREFFPWLKEKEAERRHHSIIDPRIDKPTKPMSIPIRPKLDIRQLSSLDELDDIEDDITPVRPSSYPNRLPELSPSLRSRASIDEMREKAKIAFEPITIPSRQRQDSFEMKQRGSPVKPFSSSNTSKPGSPRYEMAKLKMLRRKSSKDNNIDDSCRYDLNLSMGIEDGTGSPTEEKGKRKWWKLGRSVSGGSWSSNGSDNDRRRREESEDTVMRL